MKGKGKPKGGKKAMPKGMPMKGMPMKPKPGRGY